MTAGVRSEDPSPALAALALVDEICVRFEDEWRVGRQPVLEDFLADAPGSVRADLLPALLAVELGHRYRRGEALIAAEYLRRFPEAATVLPRLIAEAVGNEGGGGQTTPPGSEPAAVAPARTDGPAVLGDYDLLEELGRGGMGVVYKARQRSANRLVALKVVRADRLEGDSDEERRHWLDRFRREAHAAARLVHDHILPVYEVGEDGGRHFYSMRYVAGRSLADALREGPLPEREAAACLERVARAVHYAHAQGILHRDLKPGNILLDADQRPFVTDFGLAKWAEGPQEMTQIGQWLGSPPYLSPEQSQDAAGVTAASEVYSLGATLYHTLTGRPPFQAANALETLRQVREDEPVAPRQLNAAVPRDLETICLKCLGKDPKKRYATAAGLADDLRRFLNGEPIRARPTPVWERLAKWVRRYPVAAALIVALVIGVVGTTTGVLVAVDQRNLAKRREKEGLDLLIQTNVLAARLAIQRGAWREALALYDIATKGGHPNTVALRLDKIQAWVAINDVSRAARELEELAREPDLGDSAGQVDLMQGNLLLGVNDGKAEELIRRALTQQLPAADRAYASGLLAANSEKALASFLEAIQRDPFHQDAREMAGLILILLGRFDEARVHLDMSETLFPEQANFQILQALRDSLQGNEPAAEARLERIRPSINPKDLESLQALVAVLKVVRDAWPQISDPNQGKLKYFDLLSLFAKVIPQLNRFAPQAGPVASDNDLLRVSSSIRAPPIVRRVFEQYLSNVKAVLFDQINEQTLRESARRLEDHGDGSLWFLHAHLCFLNAQKFQPPRADDNVYKERLEVAIRAYEMAAQKPALFPSRAPALEALILLEGVCGSPQRKAPDLAMRKRALVHLRERRAMSAELPLPWMEVYFLTAQRGNDDNLARVILDEWTRRKPQDKGIVKRQARFELQLGAYGAAIRLARQVLGDQPGDAEMKQLLQEAADKMREELQRLGEAH